MMHRLLTQIVRNIAQQDRGTAAIELGLIAPVLATLLIGVVDLTTAYNRKLVLEQATQRGVEKIMQTTTNKTVDENVKEEAASAAGVSQDKVTLEYWLECNGTRKTSYTEDCNSGETESRYLTLSITDQFTPLFPLARLGLTGSSFTIRAKSGIRTR